MTKGPHFPFESASGARLCLLVRGYPDLVKAYGSRFADVALGLLFARVKEICVGLEAFLKAEGLRRLIVLDAVVADAIGAECLLVALGSQPFVVDGVSVLFRLSMVPEGHDTVADDPALEKGVPAAVFRQWMADVTVVFSAMRTGCLVLALQPIRAIDGNAVLYSEALARIVRVNDGGVSEVSLSPGEFLLAIEHLGLSRLFDRYVVLKTIDALSADPAALIGCNISAQSALDDDYWATIFAVLADAPQIAARLVIEITETAALSDLEAARSLVSRLKHLGCRIALDDFGAGHSSIGRAIALQPDIIKIDRIYLRDVLGGGLLNSLIELCVRLASDVVVEGVEDESDLEFARRAGAHWVQGYYIALPSIPYPSVSGARPPFVVEGIAL